MSDHAEHGRISEDRGGAGDEGTGSDSQSDVSSSSCVGREYLLKCFAWPHTIAQPKLGIFWVSRMGR